MVNVAGAMPPTSITQPIGKFLKGATDETITDIAAEDVAREVGELALHKQESSRGKGKSDEPGSTSHRNGFNGEIAPVKTIALG